MEAIQAILKPNQDEVDETILEFLAQTLEDPAMDKEERSAALIPLLLDMNFASNEERAENLVMKMLAHVHGSNVEEVIAQKEDDSAPRLLDAPVIMLEKVQEMEKQMNKTLKVQLNLREDIFTNKLINTWDDGKNAELSEESMRAKAKQEKRQEKMEKKTTSREKSQAIVRDDIIQRLTRIPVVIHNNSELAEYLGGSGPVDIHLRDITMELGGLIMLDNVNFTFVYGRRYGLIGRNGVGKTTFLKHIAAKVFDGIPQHLQILHIEQEVQGTDVSALQTILNSDVERERLLAEERKLKNYFDSIKDLEDDKRNGAEEAENAEKLNSIYQRLEEIEADRAPIKAQNILRGLGFTPEMMLMPTRQFSGGWRMRVSLALALFIQPDVLLLDEPTNHLDLHAVLWLEDYLQSWSKTVIVVSHARDFLDAVVTDITHMQDKTLTRYKGNYSFFEEKRLEIIEQRGKQIENQEKQRAHMQAFVDRWRYSAARAAMAQSRLKALERMEKLSAITIDPDIHFKFPPPSNSLQNITVIQLVDVEFGYPKTDVGMLTSVDADTVIPVAKEISDADRILFSNVNLSLQADSRVCLVGANGVGKSTLLKIIFGELKPTSGLVSISNKLRMERFSQHHIDQLNMKKTPLETFKADFPDDPVQKIRSHLGSMGITGKLQLQPVSSLSGGQKSRVALARITYTQPHMLLLDEPTNHLDLDTVEALIQGLANYEGAVFVISHDEHLITAVCNELWVLQDKKAFVYKGDFLDYKKEVMKKMKSNQ